MTKEYSVFFLVLSVFVVSCAPTYTSIRKSESALIDMKPEDTLALVVSKDAFRKNGSLKQKLSEKRIYAFEYRFKNRSKDTIRLSSGQSEIRRDNGGKTIKVLNGRDVFEAGQVNKGGYWLWALVNIFFTSSTCTNNDCSSSLVIIPIGLPIALVNVLMASSYNDNFDRDLKALCAPEIKVYPDSTVRGIVAFSGKSYDNWALDIRKDDWSISIPYSDGKETRLVKSAISFK